jgi:hypothetical protein
MKSFLLNSFPENLEAMVVAMSNGMGKGGKDEMDEFFLGKVHGPLKFF